MCDFKICETLIKSGANITICDEDGNSAIDKYISAFIGSYFKLTSQSDQIVATIKLMLDNGAVPSSKTIDKLLFDFTVIHKWIPISLRVALIKSAKSISQASLKRALKTYTAGLKYKSRDGNDFSQIIDALIEKGASVDGLIHKSTPLLLEFMKYNEFLGPLLKANFNPYFKSAFAKAVLDPKVPFSSIKAVFEKSKIDIDHAEPYQFSIREAAIIRNNEEIINLLGAKLPDDVRSKNC